MKYAFKPGSMLIWLATIGLSLMFSCTKEQHVRSSEGRDAAGSTVQYDSTGRLSIGLNEILRNIDRRSDIAVSTTRIRGYLATAKGYGVIPSGEYAGQSFTVKLSLEYSAIGNNTLTGGTAVVKIGGDRFLSVTSPDFGTFQSFCCGEGSLYRMTDGSWSFTVYGQVRHSTALAGAHNHLFAALVSSRGLMNMNIADQSGTVVAPATPPHDPGIGLLLDFKASPVSVTAR